MLKLFEMKKQLQILAKSVMYILLFHSFSLSIQAQVEYEQLLEMSMEQLEGELADCRLFKALEFAKTTLDGPNYCKESKDEAKNTLEDLIALNNQFKDNPTEEYHAKATELKSQNKTAIENYKQCFSYRIASLKITNQWATEANLDLGSYQIYSYEGHKSKYASLKEWFGEDVVKNMDDYFKAIEKEIESRKNTDIAVVTAVAGQVEYKKGGTGDWMNLKENYVLVSFDVIKTGADGLAEITIKHPDNSKGKVVVDLIPDTEIKVADLLPKPSPEWTVISVIRGTINAVTESWPSNQIFSVRAGTTCCCIRGTEVTIEHDPTLAITNVFLHHGDAYIESGGVQRTLEPGTSTSVENGIIGQSIRLPQSAIDHINSLTDIDRIQNAAVEQGQEDLYEVGDEVNNVPDKKHQVFGSMGLSVRTTYDFKQVFPKLPEDRKPYVKRIEQYSYGTSDVFYSIMSIEYYNGVEVRLQENIERTVSALLNFYNGKLIDREDMKRYIKNVDDSKLLKLTIKTHDNVDMNYQLGLIKKGQRVYGVGASYRKSDMAAYLITYTMINSMKILE